MDKKQVQYFSLVFLALFGYLGLDSFGLLKDKKQDTPAKEINYSMPRLNSQKSKTIVDEDPIQFKKHRNQDFGNKNKSTEDLDAQKKTDEALKNAMKLADNMKTKKELKKKNKDSNKSKKVAANKKINNTKDKDQVFSHESNKSLKNDDYEYEGQGGDSRISKGDIPFEQELVQENNMSVIPSVKTLLDNYKNKRINDETFYSVLELLLMDKTITSQEKVLEALYGVYSTQSFIFASQNQDRVQNALKSKFRNYLYTYSSVQNIIYTQGALRSGQQGQIMDGSRVFLLSIDSYKRTKNEKMKNIFSKFNMTFKNLSRNENSNVSKIAQKALSELGALSLAISVSNFDYYQ